MSVRFGRLRILAVLGWAGVAACSGSPSQPSAPRRHLGFVVAGPVRHRPAYRAGDGATFAYGIWPYGVHGGGHGLDGHPGFDIEYRTGAPVLAAADGVVDSVTRMRTTRRGASCA